MGIRCYRFADTDLGIDCPFPYEEDGLSAAFAVPERECDVVCRVCVGTLPDVSGYENIYKGEKLSVFRDGERFYRVFSRYDTSGVMTPAAVLCYGRDMQPTLVSENEQWIKGSYLLFDLLGIEHFLAERGRILLHASFIEYKGRAILFCGASGAGKSTQAALWEKYCNASVINGDKAAVVMRNREYFACSVPFAGTSGICRNRALPIAAVVLPEKNGENSLERLPAGKAFLRLYRNATVNVWHYGDVEKAGELLSGLCGSVPVLLLKCRPDEGAVRLLQNGLEDKDV